MLITKPIALWGGGSLIIASLGVSAVVYGVNTGTTPVAERTSSGSAAAGVDRDGNNGNGNGNGGSSNPGHPITLTGSVSGQIRPGTPATLTVTIKNKNNQAIVVTSVTGSISSVTTAALPGRPPCSPGWYSVGTFTGSKHIAKKGTGSLTLPVSLSDLSTTNQDNCKGATVQFSFTAQARQA